MPAMVEGSFASIDRQISADRAKARKSPQEPARLCTFDTARADLRIRLCDCAVSYFPPAYRFIYAAMKLVIWRLLVL